VLTGLLRDERVGMVVWEWGQCGGGGLEGSHVRDESRRVCRIDGGVNGETIATVDDIENATSV
jgi:hypothetical protein